MFQLTLRKFMATCSNLNSHQQPLMLTSLATSDKVENVKVTIHLLKARQGQDSESFIFLAVNITV